MVKLYPNPAKNYLNVEWKAGYDEASTLKIIDLQGRILIIKQYSGLAKVGTNMKRLELTGLKRGMYLLQLSLNNGSKTIKFLVE